MTTPARAAGFEDLDEVLQEEKGSLTGLDGEVLLHLGAFLAAEGRIGQHDVVAILLLNIHEVLGQGVGVQNIGRFDAVQDHVHDADDIRQRLLFLAVESVFLQDFHIGSGQVSCWLSDIRKLSPGSRPTRPRRRRCVSPILGATTLTMALISGRGV